MMFLEKINTICNYLLVGERGREGERKRRKKRVKERQREGGRKGGKIQCVISVMLQYPTS